MFEFSDETGLLLMCDGNIGIPFPTKQGNRPSSQVEEAEHTALLELWHEPQCPSQVGMDILGKLLNFRNGVKYSFVFQEGM